MKNKKILSCILSTSLLVSMPVNSVFAIDSIVVGGGATIKR